MFLGLGTEAGEALITSGFRLAQPGFWGSRGPAEWWAILNLMTGKGEAYSESFGKTASTRALKITINYFCRNL